MSTIPAMMYLAVHMCPFTYDGQNYLAIPVPELKGVMGELGKQHMLGASGALIVKPVTDDCTPDDGKNVPGVK